MGSVICLRLMDIVMIAIYWRNETFSELKLYATSLEPIKFLSHTLQLDSLTGRSFEVSHLFKQLGIWPEELLAAPLIDPGWELIPNLIAKLSWRMFIVQDEGG